MAIIAPRGPRALRYSMHFLLLSCDVSTCPNPFPHHLILTSSTRLFNCRAREISSRDCVSPTLDLLFSVLLVKSDCSSGDFDQDLCVCSMRKWRGKKGAKADFFTFPRVGKKRSEMIWLAADAMS